MASTTALPKDPATPSVEARIVDEALELFARHGIDATSLQMIADALGVTKGAVYYHFKTKDEIIRAVYAEALGEVESAVEQAEAVESVATREQALEILIPRVVALAVEKRVVFNKIRFDPVMVRMMAEDRIYRALMKRLDRLLSGDDPDAEGRVRAAAAVSVLAGVPVHHSASEFDDETFRVHLTWIIKELVVPRSEHSWVRHDSVRFHSDRTVSSGARPAPIRNEWAPIGHGDRRAGGEDDPRAATD